MNWTIAKSAMKLTLLASAALAVGLSPANAQVRLDFWTEFAAGANSKVMNEIVQDFNAANPDIIIVHTGFENTPYETALKTTFAGGNPPDLVQINAGAAAFQYAEAGQLLDLTEFLAESDAVVRTGVDSFYVLGGKSWGIPMELNVGNLFYYNKTMFAEHGIDPDQINTWNGLLEAAQTFMDAGIVPIAFGNQEGWTGNHIHNHLLLRMLGAEKYVDISLRTLDPSVTTEVKFSDPEAYKAWEVYKDILDRGFFTAGYLADDYPTANSLFLTGKAPMFTMGSWFLSDLRDKAPDLDYGFIGFPSVEGTPGKQTDLVTAGLIMSISASSDHPDEAKKFLEYIMSEPIQKKWAEDTVKMSPYTYDTSEWVYSDTFMAIAKLLSESTSAVPFLDMLEDQKCNVPWTWQASQGILSGDLTPEEAGQGHEDCVVRLIANKFN